LLNFNEKLIKRIKEKINFPLSSSFDPDEVHGKVTTKIN
jgi:hypothetical protein